MPKQKLPKSKKPQRKRKLDVGKESLELIEISKHRELINLQERIFERFNNRPDLAKLLLINPVIAFKEVRVNLSPKIADHVLRTLQHTPHLGRRRKELEKKLKKELDESPLPTNPKWVSKFLFEKLKLQPFDTRNFEPTYNESLSVEVLERLKSLRPKRRKSSDYKFRVRRGMRLEIVDWRPSVRRLDLDAELPSFKIASKIPMQVDLEQLYFYKDSHPLVQDVLELGIIQRRSFPFHSGSSYRKIKSGEKSNAFQKWISSIKFHKK